MPQRKRFFPVKQLCSVSLAVVFTWVVPDRSGVEESNEKRRRQRYARSESNNFQNIKPIAV